MANWERLNPYLLRHFLAISRAGSLSGAAKRLHCVPSNVSARLRQLEEQLGVSLFRRQAPWGGELRLGSMETTAAVRLPEVLATFHREAPRVSLSLVAGPSQYLIQEVLAGRLDAADRWAL